MANEQTPNTPAAPAAAPATPSIDPSAAGRTLRELREQRRTALRAQEAAPADPKAVTTASTIQTPSSGATSAASAGSQSTETSSKPTADPADAEIQALLAENKRIATAKRDLETRAAALKDVEELAPGLRQAHELAAKGDRLGAVRAAFAKHGDQFVKDLFWDLLKANPEAEEGEPDIDKLVEQKLTAREQAAKDAEEARKREEAAKVTERLAKVDETVGQEGFARRVAAIPSLRGAPPEIIESYGSYVGSVATFFEKNQAKFPAIAHFGVMPLAIVERAEQWRSEKAENGRLGPPPNVLEVLQAIEDNLTGAARAVAGTPAPAPRPQIPTMNSSWRQGAGSPPPPEEPQRPKTLDEIRAERRARLRGTAA